MKTILRLAITLLVGLSPSGLFAQIPNSGFENWTNTGTYLAPDGWWTANDSATGSYYPVTRSSDHYPISIGSYSMRLENNITILPDWGAFGIAWTGGWNGNNDPAFAITGHPTSLCGYYKFSPQNNDTMEIHIRLYQNGTDVGGGQFKNAGAANAWTPFIMNFSGYVDADSARIMILACYDNDAPVPHGNSVLFIDNLNFDSLISDGIADPGKWNNISVYPNPASGFLTIDFAGTNEKEAHIRIFNETGQPVLNQQSCCYRRTLTLDLSTFAKGIYFVVITSTDQEYFSKKIIIR